MDLVNQPPDSPAPLRVLCLEDSAPDAALVRAALERDGFRPAIDVAPDRAAYEACLAGPAYDLILADFSLPGFDAHGALALAQAACPETPFVCVSGVIGEEATVELLKQGADDVVLKDHLTRLPFAVRRALEERAQARALRESQAHFAAFFEEAPLGYQSLDVEGRFLEVNAEWLALLGYAREEVIGRWFGDFLAPEYVQPFRERFPLFKERGAIHSEFEMLRQDGERRFIAFEGRIAHTPEGGFRQTHCILADVSEQRRAEAALRESEQRLRLAQEAGGLGVFDADHGSGAHHWDARTREIWGVGPDEPVSDETFLAGVHPDDRGRMRAMISSRSASQAGPRFTDEYRVINRRDGSERWVSASGTTVFEEGRAVRTVGFVAEIGERKRAESALRESESRYRDLAEATSAIVWSMHADGSVDEPVAAWAEFTGQDPAAITGDGWAEAVHPDDREGAFAAWAEALTERRTADSLYRLRRHDGEYRWMHLRAVPRFDAAGQLFGWVAALSDVTEEKRVEDALQHSAAVLSNGESLAHLGSWEWDVASGISTVSEEWQRLHGLRGERVTDEDVRALCHPDDREAVQAAAERAAAGETYRVDHRIVLPRTREVRHLMTYGEPRFDARGRVTSVIGASLDVTERMRADEALHEREQRLQRALADTVAALGATVAMRDPYTAAHERRVAELASQIAGLLGWSAEAVERLGIAGLVHDIGKITIPAEILSKPSRLTESEFALIKGHSQSAYEILAPIDFGGPVAEIVLQHHERLDGSGYPRGLSGDEILPGARLLAVADVIEAMSTHRPYRAALPLEAALAEIESGAGTRYDAAASAAAVRLFRDEGYFFSE